MPVTRCVRTHRVGRMAVACTVLLVAFAAVAIPVSQSATPTHSKEEIRRYQDARLRSVTPEGYWDAIVELEAVLEDFPQTFLRGDISSQLFDYYSRVVDDPELLGGLARTAIALRPNSDGLHHSVARALVQKQVLPDLALECARKSLAFGEQKQEAFGDYGGSVADRHALLGKAYQLAGHPDDALTETLKALEQVRSLPDAQFSDLASRQYSIDRMRTALLKLHVEQQRWDDALALAEELMRTSVDRENLPGLWADAYIGKSGSADGIGRAYRRLKAGRDKELRKNLPKARVRRQAPGFALRTIDGDSVSLASLRGKTVVLSFWAGWCSPCIRELPELEELKRAFKGRPVEFLAVNIDTQTRSREGMVREKQATYGPSLTYALGDAELRRTFGSEVIPYTCILDSEGFIRVEITGLSSDLSFRLEQQLNWLLNGSSKSQEDL